MTNIEAASSSSFSRSWKYHVFVSFRGEDTRYNFTSHLQQALRQREIRTFLDYDLRRGEEISAGLVRAIEESKIFIIMFSEDYGSSKWCLDELVKILECKKTNQQTMIPVFYKVTPSDVKQVSGRFGKAFSSIQRRYGDEKEKVDKWRAALSEAANVSGHHLLDDHSEAELIQNIVEEISIRVIDRTYLYLAKYPVGIQTRVQDVNDLLDLGQEDVRMIGIWGTGGIGKTTIAKAIYNSNAHIFEYRCFLADVRERADSGLAKLQKTLLFGIVGEKFDVNNVHIGVTMIQHMLSGKKILLVLDDVDDSKQLDSLAGGCNWFGKGSRIVITARDKKLLTAHKINSIYNVKGLDYKAALELFSWHAFNKNEPLVDYVKLTNRAINCAGGVPLVLSILGSKLYGESIDKWEAALDGLIKSGDLHQIFKICYEALDDPVKEVFLDIACFFKGKHRNYVLERLEGRDLNPSYGIEVLIQKALISIEENCVCMHDLLEEMGKQVVHQESPHEPGKRSRLWFYKDVQYVLTENIGSEKVRGIMVKIPKEVDERCWNVENFSKMTNLEIFINYNARLSGDINYLPNKLKVLEWYSCPLQSVPARFHSKELVVFNMPSNRIIQLEESLKIFTKLTSLNVRNSQYLTKIPDLSGTPNLRNLYARHCRSLVEVDPSVGKLNKLEVLELAGCGGLTKFPKEVSLKSLKLFHLSGCRKFERFPEILDKMESLCELKLDGTSVKELPTSVGHLVGLELLQLAGSPIEELPSSIGYLTKLQNLGLHGTAIKELPSSVGNLIGLRSLLLKGCKNLTHLPQSIYGLRLDNLNLGWCPKLVALPNYDWESSAFCEVIDYQACNLSNIDSLEVFECSEINLSRSHFVSLPICFSNFENLQSLDLSACRQLKEISELLPPRIQWIYLNYCDSLVSFSTLSKIMEDGDMGLINGMELINCHALCDNIELDVSAMANILLKQSEDIKINVILPGNKVPEWFSCRKDDVSKIVNGTATDDEIRETATDAEICELCFEIPASVEWENTRLLFCAVFETTEVYFGYCGFDVVVTVDEVCIAKYLGCRHGLIPRSAHAWLAYYPLPVHMKPKVDKKSDQLMPRMCRVNFNRKSYADSMLFRSCGVHVAHI